ncbi:hypothetical protein JX266_004656 [Neoarthrinium moseri]|nr:hypothetical protein JX266_004656 [Neoarthrinium moseri]
MTFASVSDSERNVDQEASPKGGPKSKQSPKEPPAAELTSIHLDGEIDENAAFARELSQMMPHTRINATHVGRFQKMKGPRAGGHNPVFYAAYVYFEKLRIKQGKKKSAKREQMEEHWEEKGGFPREGSHNIYILTKPGQHWTFDAMGKPKMVGQGRPGGGWTWKCVRDHS